MKKTFAIWLITFLVSIMGMREISSQAAVQYLGELKNIFF